MVVILSRFCERLSDLRKDNNLTQKELAAIIDVSEDMLSSYERGIAQMPDDAKMKLAQHFNISLDYLFGLINEQIGYRHDSALYLPSCFTHEAIEKAQHYVKLLEMELKSI